MVADPGLPDGRLVTYYGDDFTGSTDVMEVLTFAGLPTVLFLQPPDVAALARFATCRAIGVAGTARSRSPAWMREHLPPVFHTLDALRAPILHYKICSTFDSGPHIGSIGCALELGLAASDRAWCAMVVGAPALRRYQAFGNLFASVDGVGHRLDRHPTMARHPVTPMTEADLRRHLRAQTTQEVALIDLVTLKQGCGETALQAALASGVRAVLFDVIDDETLVEAGHLIWRHRGDGLFAVASSGLEYALVAYWRAAGWLPPAELTPARGLADRVLVVSGSCSPVTAGQIGWALEHGFASVPLDVPAALDRRTSKTTIGRATDAACTALQSGRDAIVYSARGPDDPAFAALDPTAQHNLAQSLGMILAEAVQRGAPDRVVVAGGDTSGAAASRLGLYALQAVMPLDPGAPLCVGHRRGAADLEIVLKGGQIGRPDFFGAAKSGQPR